MSNNPKRGLPLWAGLLYASIASAVVIPGWLPAHDGKPADLPSCDLTKPKKKKLIKYNDSSTPYAVRRLSRSRSTSQTAPLSLCNHAPISTQNLPDPSRGPRCSAATDQRAKPWSGLLQIPLQLELVHQNTFRSLCLLLAYSVCR